MEDGYLYLRLRNMLHTIYATKLEQTIIQQYAHQRRESQAHAPAHVLMRLYPIDKSFVFFTKRKRDVMLKLETVNFKFEYIEALTTRRMIQLGTYISPAPGIDSVIAQSNLLMQSPLLSSHMYFKIIHFLARRRKYHIN